MKQPSEYDYVRRLRAVSEILVQLKSFSSIKSAGCAQVRVKCRLAGDFPTLTLP